MVDQIEEFFAGYPPDVRDISLTLRDMVLGAMPDAIERLFASQNHVSYLVTPPARDSIVYICPMQEYVRLGFYYGGNLPDPGGMLVGTGKRLRHVKVYTLQEANNPALTRLVEAAWAGAPSHRGKRA